MQLINLAQDKEKLRASVNTIMNLCFRVIFLANWRTVSLSRRILSRGVIFYVKCEVMPAANINNTVLWNVTPCVNLLAPELFL